jgi:hypothetical protein
VGNCCNTAWDKQCCNAVAISAVLHSHVWMAYSSNGPSAWHCTGRETLERPAPSSAEARNARSHSSTIMHGAVLK